MLLALREGWVSNFPALPVLILVIAWLSRLLTTKTWPLAWAGCSIHECSQHAEGGCGGRRGARWPSGLECWTGNRTVRGSNPTAENFSLRNFGNSVYPALPVSFGGDTKSRRSLLSGVYARGSKRPHQSAQECVTVVDSTTHSKLPDPQSAIMRRKTLPCTCIGRRRRRRMCNCGGLHRPL